MYDENDKRRRTYLQHYTQRFYKWIALRKNAKTLEKNATCVHACAVVDAREPQSRTLQVDKVR